MFKKNIKKLLSTHYFNISCNNLFVRKKCLVPDFKRYSTDNSNKGPKGPQTWSEYLYPFFTSDYYYAGEIVVAVTIISTGIACYYYGPAVIAYLYNDGKGNPPSSPSSSSSSQISNMADLKANSISQASKSSNASDVSSSPIAQASSSLSTSNSNTLDQTASTANNINQVAPMDTEQFIREAENAMANIPKPRNLSSTTNIIPENITAIGDIASTTVNRIVTILNKGNLNKVLTFSNKDINDQDKISKVFRLISDVYRAIKKANNENIGLNQVVLEQLEAIAEIFKDHQTYGPACTAIITYAKLYKK